MKLKHWLNFLNGTATKDNITNMNSKALYFYMKL